MADKVQIAIAEEKAVAQLAASARTLAELVNAPALELPDNQRDPYLRSGQLRTVAIYLDGVAAQVKALIAERDDLAARPVVEVTEKKAPIKKG